MIIEVNKGVFWDTESKAQSQGATEWYQNEVRPNLSSPLRDEFGRPYLRLSENHLISLEERQVYIRQSPDWARKGVEITISKKV